MTLKKPKLLMGMLLLPLAGAAFWYCDGMVLLEPWLGSEKVVLRDVAAADRRAPEVRPEPVPVLVPVVITTEAGQSYDLTRFGSWDGAGQLRQVFLPSVPSWEQAALLGDQAAESAGPGSALPPSTNRSNGASDSGETLAPAAPAEELPEHTVTVVMLSDGEHIAVVDGAVVAVGDELAAGEIVKIGQGSVVVRSTQGLVDYLLGSSRPQAHRGASRPLLAEDNR